MKKIHLFLIAIFVVSQSCSKSKVEPEFDLIDIKLNEIEVNLNPGDIFQMIATFNPSNASDQTLIWKSSNTGVASISSTGEVKAIGLGATTITAQNSRYGKSASAKIVVKQIPISKISFESDSMRLDIGDKKTLNIITSPDDAPQDGLVWTSSSISIVTVDANGELTALKPGKATVTVTTAEGDASAQIVIYVNPILIETIQIDKNELTLKVGAKEKLEASYTPHNATESILWSSSNSEIANVNDNGEVTAISEGEAIIYAKNSNGLVQAMTIVTVLPRFTFLEVNKPFNAPDGITVTLNLFEVTQDTYGTYSYYIYYTLKNNTNQAIDEKTFNMFPDGEGSPERQYGFFGRLFPGDELSRSYQFKSITELKILEYGGDFFSASPSEETLKWLSPKVK